TPGRGKVGGCRRLGPMTTPVRCARRALATESVRERVPMNLGELLSGMDATTPAAGWESVRVCDLTEDSRTVVPGSLFVAREGTKADGKAYLNQALEAGAVAVLTDDAGLTAEGVPVLCSEDVERACGLMAERFYGSPASRLKLVGVTGTNGKTTTTFLVWQLLNGA